MAATTATTYYYLPTHILFLPHPDCLTAQAVLFGGPRCAWHIFVSIRCGPVISIKRSTSVGAFESRWSRPVGPSGPAH